MAVNSWASFNDALQQATAIQLSFIVTHFMVQVIVVIATRLDLAERLIISIELIRLHLSMANGVLLWLQLAVILHRPLNR